MFAGCNGRDNRNTGAVGGGAETGSMSDTSAMSGTPGMAADTGMRADTGMHRAPADSSGAGMKADSGRTGGDRLRADSSTHNQTESGMTDSSGRSTLGKKVEKTRPDQGQPVTSKGDTINPGVDSAR